MNEYRVPELNVQNGVLKSLSFLFEYIGEMGKDYIYAVCEKQIGNETRQRAPTRSRLRLRAVEYFPRLASRSVVGAEALGCVS
eukprot:171112-Pyramimonas_sp.AAC.1